MTFLEGYIFKKEFQPLCQRIQHKRIVVIRFGFVTGFWITSIWIFFGLFGLFRFFTVNCFRIFFIIRPIPTVIAGLPGMEGLAASMMRRQLKELNLPDVHEMLTMLHQAGAKLYACELAMNMFKRTREDLIEEVDAVITVGDFYDMTAGAQLLFT